MTATYAKGATFHGMPMRNVQALLRSWLNGRTAEEASDLKTVGMNWETAVAVLDEAVVTGLLVRGKQPVDGLPGEVALLDAWNRNHAQDHYVTTSGAGFVAAAPGVPLDKDRAMRVLQDFLDRADGLNARGDMPYRVDRVWLFGSMAKGAETVNDIDVAVETSRTDSWSMEGDLGRRWVDLALEMGGPSTVRGLGSPAGCALDYLERALVFGPRRHPRISNAGVSRLKNLGCECRLVYDRARGGKVDDPLLARHPGSEGRSEGCFSKLSMPTLAASPALRPVEASLLVSGIAWDGRKWCGSGFSHAIEFGPTERSPDGTATDTFTLTDEAGNAGSWRVARRVRLGRGGYEVEVVLEAGAEVGAETASQVMTRMVRADVERAALHAGAMGGAPGAIVISVRCRSEDDADMRVAMDAYDQVSFSSSDGLAGDAFDDWEYDADDAVISTSLSHAPG